MTKYSRILRRRSRSVRGLIGRGKMDRQTPFTIEQVYYDYLLSARKAKENTLTLDLVVTPRQFLNDLLALLRGIGFQPHQATLCREKTGQPLSVNLLPAENRQRRPDSARYLNFIPGVLALVLLLGTIALPLMNKLHVIHALETSEDHLMFTSQVPVTQVF